MCGWIEGLLHLEKGVWSQKTISERLEAIFSEPQYATSVPSVNRAMKILETYGVVSKTGSRKMGYTYTLTPASSLTSTMLSQMIAMYEDFIDRMKEIRKQAAEDRDLQRAVKNQVRAAEEWNRVIGKALEIMKER
jgi:hypothetical protein